MLLCDSQPEKLDAVAKACTNITDQGILVRSSPCNVTDKSQVRDAIANADDMARSSTSSPSPVASILVNCAGITRDGRISNLSDGDWHDVLDVNLRGTFLMCQKFCEPERVSRLLVGGVTNNVVKKASEESVSGRLEVGIGGSIINIGSVVSTYGNYGQVNYGASKGGVLGLTRSLAKEMASLCWKATGAVDYIGREGNGMDGGEAKLVPPTVRVNCIQPGE